MIKALKFLLGLSLLVVVASDGEAHWKNLEAGLEFGEFAAGQKSEIGDSRVRILRINPARFELVLLNASANSSDDLMTAKEWSQHHGLVAAINASMYQKDYKTSVSLMKTRQHTNNPTLTRNKTILAFDRLTNDVPEALIIDRQCDDFSTLRKKYGTFVQSIRMISCKGENVWSKQPEKWSTAAIAMDKARNILFIHVSSPYTMYDLINILKKLPLKIDRAMYSEGGPESQLFIKTETFESEFAGRLKSETTNKRQLNIAWPIPNVVGIKRK